eukprot:CAMPEP_0195283710 /NCGR_PEP_ID=MMETSP0707-20130614/2164_1 /TAXON_ID=33640 /ORGANISM="Asterionellopsis glacialis, Strain CCMP134" /LENGTH=475 /DNA_ID=CAMNT_0040342929 /DNA_START=149 /DNA_END=1576 /DNA_ORIENTATION=+
MGFFSKLFRKKRSTKHNKSRRLGDCDGHYNQIHGLEGNEDNDNNNSSNNSSNNNSNNNSNISSNNNSNNNKSKTELEDMETQWRQQVEQANTALELAKFQSVQRERELRGELESLKEQHTQMLEQHKQQALLEERLFLQKQELEKQQAVAVEEARETWKAEHANEIDELLLQLDLVEDEHRAEMERLTVEKEEVVSKLHNQSQDSSTNGGKAAVVVAEEEPQQDDDKEASAHIVATEHAETKLALEKSQTECTRLSEQLAETILAHERVLVKERREHSNMCQRIKAKMVQAAQEQFGRANEIYETLKKDHEALQAENAKLQEEIPKLKDQVQYSVTNQIHRDAENKSDVAQLKLDLAAAETSLARATREYTSEMEIWGITKQNLLNRLQAAELNCGVAHQSLATLDQEKRKLQNELEETKNVCEELMTLAESGYSKNGSSITSTTSDTANGHPEVVTTTRTYHHPVNKAVLIEQE